MSPLHSLTAFTVIQAFFPKQFRLTPADLAVLLKRNEQAIRNQISAGHFPIPSYREGGKRFCDVRDVAAYLDGQRSTVEKKPGRPTKASRIEARLEGGAK